MPRESFSKWNQFIELTPTQLEKLILALQKMEVAFVNLHSIQQLLSQKQVSTKKVVHFSLDDGYEDNYQYAYPVFRKYAVPFSIFVTTDFIDNPSPFIWWYCIEEIVNRQLEIDLNRFGLVITKEDYQVRSQEAIFLELKTLFLSYVDSDRAYFQQTIHSIIKEYQLSVPAMLRWTQLIEMHESGICEIGAHTHTHTRFANVDIATKESEVTKSKQIIESYTGVPCRFFAYPYGNYTDIVDWREAESVLIKSKVDLALTTIPHLFTTTCQWSRMPRVFLNEASNNYTLLTRISGIYQKTHHGTFE